MDPNLPVEKFPGIGKYYSYKLKKLEVKTVEDLVYHFPFRYDDFSKIAQIANINLDEAISVQGIIWQIKNIRTKNGKFITRATIADQSGVIEVIWFNQPFLTKNLKSGLEVSLAGKVKFEGRKPVLMSPSYEIIRQNKPETRNQKLETIHTSRLVPIYPETNGVSSKWLRAKIANVLPSYLANLKDFLPSDILKRQKLTTLASALSKIHFPESYRDADSARRRLAFDEIFLIQLAAALRKRDWQKKRKALAMVIDKEKLPEFVKNLPFKLTSAQKRAAREIVLDLKRETPANRLLEGDVGSGKTIVAAIAAYIAALNGVETLVAAPTEILAFQHHKTLSEILAPLAINVGIWTASKKQKGEITCGTHALLSSFEPEKQIGLVVVDEQHRFGVTQRAKLFLEKSQKLTPHLLTMTATPIPRTLALTLYGDLDLSVLDEMPTGRQKISTFVVPASKRADAYKFIEKQVQGGRQTFIITPFVEPSETMATVKAATLEFEKLKKKFSRAIRLGLLHGRLKSKDKEKVITLFKNNQLDILVATPVVEVGIDIPNATIMMIESAERFGLAQLHQLRGRVGRGEHKSYCLLFTDSNSPQSLKRLRSMEKLHVGFELAEIDLKMRGPGDIFGLRQSGFLNLKIADLSDQPLVAKAQQEAKILIDDDPNLDNFPLLAQKINKFQSEYIQPN